MAVIATPRLVFIVGNGFDLNLGLRTGYTHFLVSSDFDRLLSKGNVICRHLREKHELQNWIDIEQELKECEKEINSEILKSHFLELCSSLKTYLKGISKEINRSSSAYIVLKGLLESEYWPDILIVDYNFTSTISDILTEIGIPNYLIGDHLLKIHGSLEIDEVIFGIEDSHLLRSKSNIILKKSASRIFSPFDVDRYLTQAEKVVFFGHSLGETDHSDFNSYFQDARFRQLGRKDITIYHYGNQGFEDIQAQLDILTGRSLGNFRRFNEVEYIDSSIPINK